MSILRVVTPPSTLPKPATNAEHRTFELRIRIPRAAAPNFTAYREVIYKDEDGLVVEAPSDQPKGYELNITVTPELLAAEPELQATIGWIAAFIDRHDTTLPQ